jgi:hypothetical protein
VKHQVFSWIYHFSFGEYEGLDPVADVLEHEIVHVLEQRYLADEVEAEVVPDVPAQPLRQVADDAALVDAARGRPPLPLVLPHPVPEALRQLLALRPELHAPQPRVHRLLLGRRRVQKHLAVHTVDRQPLQLDHAYRMNVWLP